MVETMLTAVGRVESLDVHDPVDEHVVAGPQLERGLVLVQRRRPVHLVRQDLSPVQVQDEAVVAPQVHFQGAGVRRPDVAADELRAQPVRQRNDRPPKQLTQHLFVMDEISSDLMSPSP